MLRDNNKIGSIGAVNFEMCIGLNAGRAVHVRRFSDSALYKVGAIKTLLRSYYCFNIQENIRSLFRA